MCKRKKNMERILLLGAHPYNPGSDPFLRAPLHMNRREHIESREKFNNNNKVIQKGFFFRDGDMFQLTKSLLVQA